MLITQKVDYATCCNAGKPIRHAYSWLNAFVCSVLRFIGRNTCLVRLYVCLSVCRVRTPI